MPSSGKSQKESGSGRASPASGSCPGRDAGMGLMDSGSVFGTSNHAVSPFQDETVW